jgi:Fe-S-cluster containining protein
MSDFFCHGCGLCCTKVGEMLENRSQINGPWGELMMEFPHRADIHGNCEMLSSDGSCMVYDDRPRLCNVEITREVVEPQTPIDKWFSEQERHCKILLKESGVHEKVINKIYAKENRGEAVVH